MKDELGKGRGGEKETWGVRSTGREGGRGRGLGGEARFMGNQGKADRKQQEGKPGGNDGKSKYKSYEEKKGLLSLANRPLSEVKQHCVWPPLLGRVAAWRRIFLSFLDAFIPLLTSVI